MTNKDYYWFTAHNGTPKCDWLYIKNANFYGFNNEPPYEVIKEYDLRLVTVGTWSELCDRYF